jgi:hypothetical protein
MQNTVIKNFSPTDAQLDSLKNNLKFANLKLFLNVGLLLPFEDFTSVFDVFWIGYRPIAG